MSSPKPATQLQPLDERVEMASAGKSKLEASHSSGDDKNQDMAAYENRSMDLRTVGAIVALAVTYEAALLSYVLPVAILLTINADIGPSAQINWIATAWSLATAVVQTVTGRCSDIFGRRNFTIAGNLFGLIGCAIACKATSVNQVIAGTTLMGIGSGPQQLSFACANEIVPKKFRGQTLAFLNLAALPGSAFGSVIAYALVAHLSWRWAFYIGILANGLALVLIVLFYWPPGFLSLHPEGKSRLQQFKELDFAGLLLFSGGLTSFLLGLSFGNNPYPWKSAHVLAPMLIGAATILVAFPAWELNAPHNIAKLCPPSIFKNFRGFALPLCVIFVSGMLPSSPMATARVNPFLKSVGCADLDPEVQLLFASNPTTIGWYSLSYNAASTLGALTSGVLFARIRKTRWQFFTVTIIQTVFIAAMASVDQHSPRRAIGFVIVAAFGVGASQIIGLLIIQFGAADDRIGVATGLTGSIRATGGAIAIAIYGSIIHNKVSQNLVPEVAQAALAAGLPPSAAEAFITALTSGSVTALGAIQGVTPAIIAAGGDAVKTVYAQAFQLVFLISIAFGGFSIFAAFFVNSVDHLLTRQVVVKLEQPHLFHSHKANQEDFMDKEAARQESI